MTKYRIAYIDESPEEIRKFQRYAYDRFEVVPIIPTPEIGNTLSIILESKVDAIVADYDFKERAPEILYNGTKLVEEFLKEREGFPVFIFTSFDEDAMNNGDNVNIIYEKGEQYFLDKEGKSSRNEKLLDRIKLQIDKYYHKLYEAEEKLLYLIKKNIDGVLDAYEEEELEDLNSFIEKSLDKKKALPAKLIRTSEGDKLGEIIKKVDELIKKLT